MTVPYHERSNVAHTPGGWARGFAIFALVLSLGGCSVSMPMSGLIDGSPNGAVAAKAANDPSAGPPTEKPVVEVAAAQPVL